VVVNVFDECSVPLMETFLDINLCSAIGFHVFRVVARLKLLTVSDTLYANGLVWQQEEERKREGRSLRNLRCV